MWESAAADSNDIVAGAYSAEVAADSAIAAPVATVAPAESAGLATKAGSHSHKSNTSLGVKRRSIMKKGWIVLCALLFIAGTSGHALADNATILKEIQSLEERIEELEEKLEEQDSLAKRQAAKTEAGIEEKIGEALEERFGTLETHGGAVLYYQGSQVSQLNGEYANSPSGAGFTADLELTWKPALPLVENGIFYARIHAGDGTGADRGGQPNNPVNVLLANLNTIADDNSGGNDTGLNLLEAHYTHQFFDKTLSVTGGKANTLLFLDGNAFANNDKKQFVGKPFVNNSVLDSESEYTPLLGGEFNF
jgi:hypothetical protein